MPSLDTYIKSITDTKIWYIDESFGAVQKSEYASLVSAVGVKEAAELYSKSFKASNGAFHSGAKLNINEVSSLQSSHIEFKLSGVMLSEDGFCESGIENLTNPIIAAAENPNIKTAKLRINSGGGELGAAIKLFNALEIFVASGKEIEGVVEGVMASGALLGTLPIKNIYADSEFSQVGSIGVMMSISRDAIKYEKENILSIFSTLSPDKQGEIRQLVNEEKTDKLVERLDTLAQLFHSKVMSYRDLDPELKEEALRGGVFIAEKAAKMGLISPKLYKSTNTNMFKEIVQALNKAFGTSLADDANEEQVKAALASFNLSEVVNAKVSEEVAKVAPEQGESIDAKIASFHGSEDFSTSVKTIADESAKLAVAEAMKAANAEIAELKVSLSKVSTALAENIGGSTQTSQNSGHVAPGQNVKQPDADFITGEVVEFANAKY